jgi:glutamine---fructose-6-phosphate transaminase (isomerizing)
MCGIVGYLGNREAQPILLEGLRRLEYRGYDIAGIATLTGAALHLRKRAGRVSDLAKHLQSHAAAGCHGISHTRWATHGPANDRNAHPHVSQDGTVAVVHNGVIENYAGLKRQLQEAGVVFASDTDTEVIAQLIATHYRDDLVDTVRKVTGMLKGTYGLAVISTRQPNVLVGARLGSPLVLGVGNKETFLASDPAALLGNTEKVVYLKDHQMCVIGAESWHVLDANHAQDRAQRIDATVHQIERDAGEADKGIFEHYMLKEIFEQPEAIENALRGRLDRDSATAKFGGFNLTPQELRSAGRIIITRSEEHTSELQSL